MNICIIGGGIVGLNIAYALCEQHHEIYLFEQEPFLGHHTSSRNSEVIHAGLAYPSDSLKMRLCLEGNRLSYDLLNKLNVPNRQCGKWIVATNNEELAALHRMVEHANSSGAKTVRMDTVQMAMEAEPALHNLKGAAFSPSSGIIDTAAYIRALEVAISKHERTNILYPCRVTGINGHEIETTRGKITFDLLINAAGLFADETYKMAGGSRSFQIVPFKGEYYLWRGGKVKTLIYPVPRKFLDAERGDPTKTGNFGIHLHRTIAGDVLAGPSLIKLPPDKKTDYSITSSGEDFAEEVSPYIKGIDHTQLTPAQAGNRPKLFEDGKPVEDFQIFRGGDIVHLLGIESPGLTAAPAIARLVMEIILH